jgi:peptide deformylase
MTYPHINDVMTKQRTTTNHPPEIVQTGHPALHTPAQAIPLTDIGSPAIKSVIADMIAALESQKDGVGIAAPQIGESLRIFIVAGFVYDRVQIQRIKKKFGATEEAQAQIKALKKSPHQIFINPEITKESKDKKWFEGEGCLSVRWVYGKVYRSTRVTLTWYDENGVFHELGASGFLAHIFQHEVDHLNGILFIDKAKDLEEFDPEEIKKEHEDHH